MTKEKAIKRFEELYKKAIEMPRIKNPVAWALYQVWKEADRND